MKKIWLPILRYPAYMTQMLFRSIISKILLYVPSENYPQVSRSSEKYQAEVLKLRTPNITNRMTTFKLQGTKF